MKRGDEVLVWDGARRGKFLCADGNRACVELVDDKPDPPAGYRAWWRHDEVWPADTITIGSLFSGIGGLDLGLEMATGGRTIWQCESDDFCRRVLRTHWPTLTCYKDVHNVDEKATTPDILCGGFPCQDISAAGKRAGIEGERSGLWSEFSRVIRVLRPPIVFVENVRALTVRGLDRVLGDLAACGYDAQWDCIGACCVGAPHRRERMFVLAYPQGGVPDSLRDRLRQQRERHGEQRRESGETVAGNHGAHRSMADTEGAAGRREAGNAEGGIRSAALGLRAQELGGFGGGGGASVPDTDSGRREELGQPQHGGEQRACRRESLRCGALREQRDKPTRDHWTAEPNVGRVAPRFSPGMDGGVGVRNSQDGTQKILQEMRRNPDTQALQWTSGGSGGLQAAKALLSYVWQHEGAPEALGNVSLEGTQVSGIIVRSVWIDGRFACPSCRRSAQEQCEGEYPDPLRVLSQLLACACSAARLDAAGKAPGSKASSRLRALGNAVVPQQAARAWELLMSRIV